MKKTNSIQRLLFFLSLTLFFSCTEPYQLQTDTFEEAYVVEATITNELKKQHIKFTKTYLFEENGPTFQSGAQVYIEDDLGNQYNFIEADDRYESEIEFQAENGRLYTLFITTADGAEYKSTIQNLTTVTEIENLETNVVTKNGQTGVQIGVNSYDPTGTSKYYRYEYEETNKVTAPKWNPYRAILLDHPMICFSPTFPGFETIGFELRPYPSQTCYTTTNSIDILQTSTTTNTEDRVANFPIRFIANTDYTIAERYSILVRQYVQNFEAYSFYKSLKEMSGSGNLLSPIQPGFINGNIKSITNPKEKVIGFFEVASVSEKRIFFNYDDIFPDTPPPPYFTECVELAFDSMHFGDPPFSPDIPCGAGGEGGQLRDAIRTNRLRFYRDQFPIIIMVKPACGDCTSFSSNVIPSFWQ